MPLGGDTIDACCFVRTSSCYSPLKEGSSRRGLFNSCTAHYGITCRRRPTPKQGNTRIHAGGNIGVVFISLFFLYGLVKKPYTHDIVPDILVYISCYECGIINIYHIHCSQNMIQTLLKNSCLGLMRWTTW